MPVHSAIKGDRQMSIEIPLLLLVLLVIINVVVGGVLYRLLSHLWSVKPVEAKKLAPDVQKRTLHFQGRLHELLAQVDTDIGDHADGLSDVSDEISGLSPSSENTVEAISLTIERLATLNATLQEQLVDARSELESQREQVESTMEEARRDALTGLANRRAFDEFLAKCARERERRKAPVTLLMLDVDHFKKVNDRHGHPTGDSVLRGLAHVLAREVRDSDLIARYGGEEFAAVLVGSDIDEAMGVAERIRNAVASSLFRTKKTQLKGTVSIGVTAVQPGEDPAAIVDRADAALYRSKDAGRNCVHVHDGVGCEASAVSPVPHQETVYHC
jgi:diguanylate cyclase